jgi:DNA-binding beta-propeller fold protein YncE
MNKRRGCCAGARLAARISVWTVAIALWGAAAGGAATTTTGGNYHLLKKVTLGGEGMWDYLVCDSHARLLYITRGTLVMVVNADTYAVVGDIPGKGVHGVALAPEFGRGFISDGKANAVIIFDLKTLKVLGSVPAGNKPDAIVYDSVSRRVFAFNGDSGTATVVDAASGKVVGTITLGGDPEFAVADGQGHIYNNLEDKSELVRIDSRKLTVTAHWPLAPCESPSGLAMDKESRRLFSGCHNQMVAVVDADSGKVLATPAIGRGVDANAFDPGTHLIFSSNGDGTLTVIHEGPAGVTPVASVPTQRGARTMALDLKTHRVYLVTAEFGASPTPTADHPHPRPVAIPGTFTLLVFGP